MHPIFLLNANAEVEKEIMHKKLIIFFIFIPPVDDYCFFVVLIVQDAESL